MPGIFGGGSQSSTTQVNVPPPTAAELALQEVNLDTARVLFDQLVISTNLQNNVLLPLFAQQAGIILERAPAAGADGALPEGSLLAGLEPGVEFLPQQAAPAGAAPAADTAALQEQMRRLQLDAQRQRDNLTEEGQPGEVDVRTQRQIDAVQAQITTATAGPAPGAGAPTTGVAAPGAITGFSLTPEAQRRVDLSQQVQTAGLEAQLSATESANALAQTLIQETPEFSLEEALSFIDLAAKSAISSGENEIIKFQSLALENLRDVIAPSRGLRPTDTPIGEFAGGRVLEESVRQQGQLVRDVSTTSEQLKVSAQQFQASLEQAAFVNRSNLLGTLGNFGLGFPAAPSPGATVGAAGAFGANLAQGGIPGAGLQASLSSQRLATAGSTTTSSGGGDILGGFAGLAQGLGTLGFSPFGGAAAAGGIGAASAGSLAGIAAADVALFPAIFSSRAFKTQNASIDVDAILAAVQRLDVEQWVYKPEMQLGQAQHIGPYAEDFRKAFEVGNGVTIHPADALGVLFAAVQALAARLEELEN